MWKLIRSALLWIKYRVFTLMVVAVAVIGTCLWTVYVAHTTATMYCIVVVEIELSRRCFSLGRGVFSRFVLAAVLHSGWMRNSPYFTINHCQPPFNPQNGGRRW